MNTRTLGILMAILSVAAMVGARIGYVNRSGFGADDLARFEDQSYGIDLPEWYEDSPFFLAWSRGDGQAFVTLGIDPLAKGPSQKLGIPLYRYGRVGYSVLARAAVGWNADLVPVGLWLINTIAVGVLGWIAGTRMRELGPRSLLIPFNPAVFVGYTADTAEVLAITSITIALFARRKWLIASLGVLLGVTRESFITAAPVLKRGVLFAAAAAVGIVAIRIFGMTGLGLPWTGTAGNLTIPLEGYLSAWGTQDLAARAASTGVLVAALLTLWTGVRERTGLERVAFLATALLVISLADIVVAAPRNILRAAGAIAILWTSIPPAGDPRHEVVDLGLETREVATVVDDDVSEG